VPEVRPEDDNVTSHPLASGFGECAACGCGVERVGWDDLCFRCQEAEKAELVDDDEEDDQ
jgi:hypothetical protein